MNRIYLDANATTPLLPEVADAMRSAEAEGFANPSSQHAAGRRAKRLVEDARERIAEILGARVDSRNADSVLFTSGGTESNNLALRGLTAAHTSSAVATANRGGLGRIVISAVEHSSIFRVAERMRASGWHVDQLFVNSEGVVGAGQLAGCLTSDTRLVSVMLANHETGVLQPVCELAATCARRGVLMHTDAAQVVGKLPVDFGRLGISAMTVSAHKFHGPKGIGVLVIRHGVPLEPLHHGGHHQGGLRAGTEPVALCVGMRVALEAYSRERDARAARFRMLTNRFEQAITSGWPGAVVLGAGADRVPNVSAIALIGLDRQALIMALDQAGVACATGAACESGSSQSSPTLTAMACRPEVITSGIRFSITAHTTSGEIDEAVRRILRVARQLGRPRNR